MDETQRDIWAKAYRFCEKWNHEIKEPDDFKGPAVEMTQIAYGVNNHPLAFGLLMTVYEYLEDQYKEYRAEHEAKEEPLPEPEPVATEEPAEAQEEAVQQSMLDF